MVKQAEHRSNAFALECHRLSSVWSHDANVKNLNRLFKTIYMLNFFMLMPLAPVGADVTQMLLYLDPGTGSLLFSVIVGVVSTAYFVAKDVLYQIKTFITMRLQRKPVASLRTMHREEHAVIFYSEGKQYQATFRPLVEEMGRRNLPCLYLTSDHSDPLLGFANDQSYPSIHAECIGNGHIAWARLRTLRAKLVCMTTPGLDVLQIRRSPHVHHYMHIVHSPTDKSFNRPYSFDFFDSVLINGPHQERVIRYLESLRGSKKKDLFNIGCIYYDALQAEFALARARVLAAKEASNRNSFTVLLAPTWGKNGLLSRYGSRLIKEISDIGAEIIIRPHPQTAVSEPELLNRLQDETASFKNCRWDMSSSPVDAMALSDILISDISGIVFDYTFLANRPVLTLDFEVDKRGFEAMDLPFEPWEISILDLIGRRINMNDIASLKTIIEVEVKSTARADEIRRLRENYVTNFGDASSAAVKLITTLAALSTLPHTKNDAGLVSKNLKSCESSSARETIAVEFKN